MEREDGSSADEPDASASASQHFDASTRLSRTRRHHLTILLLGVGLCLGLAACGDRNPTSNALARIRSSGRLVYGSDQEGGGPYIFPDPAAPREVTGFEVEMMRTLAEGLGARPVFAQGQWDRLLQNLDNGQIDLVVNGYEWTETRGQNYLATRPYYVYQLQLLARRDGPIRSWDDVSHRTRQDGRRWKVGVLVGSAADTFAEQEGGEFVEVVRFDGATDAMTATVNGQVDATLQDLPAAIFYRERFAALNFAGDPVGRGYYVMYFRRGDEALRDAVNRRLGEMITGGQLESLYKRYGIWNSAQTALAGLSVEALHVGGNVEPRGLPLLIKYGRRLTDAAVVTIILSLASMPLAMAIGLAVALGRLYGPGWLRTVLTGYIELIRGTPLMLQLYVLFYLLRLPPWVAGIAGLAINYSAYEAEIYRAGLQAIPAGQMEAALALGMSRSLALKRIIVPQAVRIVIPPVTNDFIALFKDTSVCSVITLVELTKQYSILANSTGGVLEFALATAFLYMAMSVPLSWFSRWSEQRLSASGAKGGALA
ncbi:MAG: ABC transporter permease subunit [Isosphaeraceae bacterium]